jgi:glycosyltransferase involved in cell wall biosynthesis
MTDDVRNAVLIPCYNEEMTIAKVVSDAPAMMSGS